MKTKIFLLAVLFSFYSCSEMFPGNGKFVVHSVQEGRKTTCYQLSQTQGKGQTWIRDSVGKYHVGDTLRLSFLK